MPELPEVETVARTLLPLVQHRRIVLAEALHPKVMEGPLPLEAVVGRTISTTARRGKLLLVPFIPALPEHAPGLHEVTGIAFHLKMTGRLFGYAAGVVPGVHTRLRMVFDDNSQLFFDDMRTFGYARVLSQQSLEQWNFWQTLGPEPLTLAAKEFVQLFAGKQRAIKALLLDQQIIAGVGNIYADESLFRAGIHPASSGKDLSPQKLERLHGALVGVLQESIAACGSSINTYRTARGDAGAFQNTFAVYGRGGQNCSLCTTRLEKTQLAGRGTVFCPKCQKLGDKHA